MEDVSGVSGGNISQLTAEIVDHPVTVDTQQVCDVGCVLGVLRLDVSLGLLANTNKGLGHLSHVHHAGSVLGNYRICFRNIRKNHSSLNYFSLDLSVFNYYYFCKLC